MRHTSLAIAIGSLLAALAIVGCNTSQFMKGAVSGRVIDIVTAQGVPGAMVTAFNNGGAQVGFTLADEEGNYRIDDLVAGSVALHASADGYDEGTLSVLIDSGGTLQNKDIGVSPHRGGVEGIVLDADNNLNPISGVRVRAQIVGGSGRSATTDNQGAYQIDGLVDGDYTVTATRAGYVEQVKNVTIQDAATETVNFALNQVP
jgi:hypothetical protein